MKNKFVFLTPNHVRRIIVFVTTVVEGSSRSNHLGRSLGRFVVGHVRNHACVQVAYEYEEIDIAVQIEHKYARNDTTFHDHLYPTRNVVLCGELFHDRFERSVVVACDGFVFRILCHPRTSRVVSQGEGFCKLNNQVFN